MTRRARTIGVIVAVVVAATALTGAGILTSQRPASTTITVHLTDLSGRPLTTIDRFVVVEISAAGENYERYASAAPTGCYKHRCTPGRVGGVTGGVASFPNLPAHQTFVVSVDAGHGFDSRPYGELRVAPQHTKSITVPLTHLATVSGRVVGVDGHTPAAGIWVAASDLRSGYAVHRGKTNSDGRYSIIGLPSATYRIKFNAAKFGNVIGDTRYIWTFSDRLVSVTAESRRAGPTGASGVDGRLVAGHTLSVVERLHGNPPDDEHSGADFLGGTSNNTEADYVADIATARIAPGEYYLRTSVFNSKLDEDVEFWYAGDGKREVSERKDAVPVQFDGTHDVTVRFGSRR